MKTRKYSFFTVLKKGELHFIPLDDGCKNEIKVGERLVLEKEPEEYSLIRNTIEKLVHEMSFLEEDGHKKALDIWFVDSRREHSCWITVDATKNKIIINKNELYSLTFGIGDSFKDFANLRYYLIDLFKEKNFSLVNSKPPYDTKKIFCLSEDGMMIIQEGMK